MLNALVSIAYVVFIVTSVVMVGAILLQEGKGGGLSALGGTRAESAFGASNPVRRMTVVLAIIFFVLAAFLSIMSSREGAGPGTDAVEEDAGGAAEKKASPEGEGSEAGEASPEGEGPEAERPQREKGAGAAPKKDAPDTEETPAP